MAPTKQAACKSTRGMALRKAPTTNASLPLPPAADEAVLLPPRHRRSLQERIQSVGTGADLCAYMCFKLGVCADMRTSTHAWRHALAVACAGHQ